MAVVIDASVIVKWVLREAGSAAAFALRTQALIAPSLWSAEVGNVLWRRAMQGELTPAEASDLLSDLQQAALKEVPIGGLAADALTLSLELNHPIYDCLYLALAIREETYVVTADRRFAALAEKRADLNGRIRALA